jgi:hypothetical protein
VPASPVAHEAEDSVGHADADFDGFSLSIHDAFAFPHSEATFWFLSAF